jgi:hypothetical protein
MLNPVSRSGGGLRWALVSLIVGALFCGWVPAFGQEAVPATAREVAADDYLPWGIYAQTAPSSRGGSSCRHSIAAGVASRDRIVVIGNTLAERSQGFGQFEAMLQQTYPELRFTDTLTVLCHSAFSSHIARCRSSMGSCCRHSELIH